MLTDCLFIIRYILWRDVWKPPVTEISEFPDGGGRSTCALSTRSDKRLRAFPTFRDIFFLSY